MHSTCPVPPGFRGAARRGHGTTALKLGVVVPEGAVRLVKLHVLPPLMWFVMPGMGPLRSREKLRADPALARLIIHILLPTIVFIQNIAVMKVSQLPVKKKPALRNLESGTRWPIGAKVCLAPVSRITRTSAVCRTRWCVCSRIEPGASARTPKSAERSTAAWRERAPWSFAPSRRSCWFCPEKSLGTGVRGRSTARPFSTRRAGAKPDLGLLLHSPLR